ncbi:cytochrome P450 [Embleya sp. NPDC127516]|uniref:cytochrome P450 n=1 Tax=Embleya sp. NPDC127516 TaxID=3363990 RepID=UPI003819194F
MTTPLYLPNAYQLYSREFARDQQGHYRDMRANHGVIAPVEIAPGVYGHLVIGYRAALELLHDTETWSKDPTTWAASLSSDHPILGMLGPRPNPLYTDGTAHERYRRVVTDCFDLVEPHHLRDLVREIADQLIDRFAHSGQVDLITDFSRPLPSYVFNRLFGQRDDAAPQLISALASLLESGAGEAEFYEYMNRLVGAKLERRDNDLTSWFLDHPADLSTEELLHTVVLTVAAGQEPTTNLIANTLSLMLSDNQYYNDLSNGALSTEHAIGRILRERPPMSNFAPHYPTRTVNFHGTTIPAHTLVMVSFAAANTDPNGPGTDRIAGGGAHLAWSAGPHACPVRHDALLIATTAIEQLIRRCTDLELTIPEEELEARIGPFHSALAHLPARFTPLRSTRRAGSRAWPGNPFSAAIPTTTN